jgi:hypothetical protein
MKTRDYEKNQVSKAKKDHAKQELSSMDVKNNTMSTIFSTASTSSYPKGTYRYMAPDQLEVRMHLIENKY